MALRRMALMALGLTALAGCGERSVPDLMQLRSETPDEFGVLPNRPLELPPDYASLPPPAPGGANRADPNPQEDILAALGGDPDARRATGAADADTGLLAATGADAASPEIRETLAEEDIAFRRKNRGNWVGRSLGRSEYFNAYAPQSLDAYKELDKFREQGVRTPAAPPRR